MLTNKVKKCLLTVVAVTFIAAAVPVFAIEDSIAYEFNLKTGYANAYSEGRYRQTTNLQNKWKVDMRYHSRGTTKRATYWLARTGDKERVSETVDATASSSKRYLPAWKGASQCNVCLGCENYDNATATVSGYWDEEVD